MKDRFAKIGYGIIGAVALLIVLEFYKDWRFLHTVRIQSEHAPTQQQEPVRRPPPQPEP